MSRILWESSAMRVIDSTIAELSRRQMDSGGATSTEASVVSMHRTLSEVALLGFDRPLEELHPHGVQVVGDVQTMPADSENGVRCSEQLRAATHVLSGTALKKQILCDFDSTGSIPMHERGNVTCIMSATRRFVSAPFEAELLGLCAQRTVAGVWNGSIYSQVAVRCTPTTALANGRVASPLPAEIAAAGSDGSTVAIAVSVAVSVAVVALAAIGIVYFRESPRHVLSSRSLNAIRRFCRA